MIEIHFDESFKKSYKKISKNNMGFKDKFKDKLDLLISNPFHPSLKTHKLSGQLKDYFAFSVDYKTRVIFKFINGTTILLIDIGSHDVIY